MAALVVSTSGRDKWWKRGGGTMDPEDVSPILARQFGDSEIGDVVAQLNELFQRTAPGTTGGRSPQASAPTLAPSNRRRLQ